MYSFMIKTIIFLIGFLYTLTNIQVGYCTEFTHEALIEKLTVKEEINKLSLKTQNTHNSQALIMVNVEKEKGLSIFADSVYQKKKTKYVEAAILIAAVPGFFIHGSGHLYVDKPKTFLILFSTEVVIIAGVYSYGMRGFNGNENESDLAFSLAIVGLWLGTWAYDIFGSAMIANDMKRSQKIALIIQPALYKNDITTIVKLTYSF